MTTDIESLTEISSGIKDVQSRLDIMLQEVEHISSKQNNKKTPKNSLKRTLTENIHG